MVEAARGPVADCSGSTPQRSGSTKHSASTRAPSGNSLPRYVAQPSETNDAGHFDIWGTTLAVGPSRDGIWKLFGHFYRPLLLPCFLRRCRFFFAGGPGSESIQPGSASTATISNATLAM